MSDHYLRCVGGNHGRLFPIGLSSSRWIAQNWLFLALPALALRPFYFNNFTVHIFQGILTM